MKESRVRIIQSTAMTADDLKAKLRNLNNLPLPIVDWQVKIGLDATGEEAVWVWAILEDDIEVDKKARWELWEIIQKKITTEKINWVYLRFRGISEVSIV